MAVTLGPHQYGKAEVRLVTVSRNGPVHTIKDLTVSTALRGDFAETYLTGDNSKVAPTDTQKNAVYVLAKQKPVGEIEAFALRLAHHFVGDYAHITGARVYIEEHGWDRIAVNGRPHDHAFASASGETRTTEVTVDRGESGGDTVTVRSGLSGLVVFTSAGSEFHGYPKDRLTTLPETTDRILATEVTARWRHAAESTSEPDWGASFAAAREAMLAAFATTHSFSLQQTLFAMGTAALEAVPGIVELHLSMPNKHHFAVDLGPFGLTNDNEVFYAADRPYGLIEGTVLREGETPQL